MWSLSRLLGYSGITEGEAQLGEVGLSQEAVCLPCSHPICLLPVYHELSSLSPAPASSVAMMFSLKLGLETMRLTMLDKAPETVSSDKLSLPWFVSARHFVTVAGKAVNTMHKQMALRRYIEMFGGPRVSFTSAFILAYPRLWVWLPSRTEALKKQEWQDGLGGKSS